jgi:N-hydroxyarylamine O-acetyltransferase
LGEVAEPEEMSAFRPDLKKYFERIGYTGAAAADLKTLREIHLLHAQSIPFENLNSFSGMPVVMDPTAIELKILHQGRGGYCFEQNLYFSLVLKAIGFDLRYRMARVGWMVPEGTAAGRGHMALNVMVDGEAYLCDVGFGGMTLTAPLRLSSGDEQPTPHETFRIVKKPDAHVLEVKILGEWKKIYSFDLLDQHPVDYEAVNWYVSTHPKSHFVTSLLVARATEGGRLSLSDNFFTRRRTGSDSEKKSLRSIAEIRSVLETEFRIRLPDHPGVDAALNRIVAQG